MLRNIFFILRLVLVSSAIMLGIMQIATGGFLLPSLVADWTGAEDCANFWGTAASCDFYPVAEPSVAGYFIVNAIVAAFVIGVMAFNMFLVEKEEDAIEDMIQETMYVRKCSREEAEDYLAQQESIANENGSTIYPY